MEIIRYERSRNAEQNESEWDLETKLRSIYPEGTREPHQKIDYLYLENSRILLGPRGNNTVANTTETLNSLLKMLET